MFCCDMCVGNCVQSVGAQSVKACGDVIFRRIKRITKTQTFLCGTLALKSVVTLKVQLFHEDCINAAFVWICRWVQFKTADLLR